MPENTANTPPVTPAGCLLRLFWLVLGNATIFLSLATVAVTRAPLPSYLDVIVLIAVISMIAVRWLEIARFGGRTLGDEPASPRHWRRYVVSLVSATLAAWALAHLLAGSFSA